MSVVIVSWNTAPLLRECLRSLLDESSGDALQVVVVDNGSSDGSAEMVAREFPGVELVRNRGNVGFARATNQGFELARAPLVLLLNSDTVVPAGTIEACEAHLDAHPRAAIVGCRLTFPDGTPQSSCFRFPSLRAVCMEAAGLSRLFPRSAWFNADRYGQESFTEPREVDCVMGSFFLLRRAAVETKPLFDEGYFMYGEEADLCRRLAERGWSTRFDPAPQAIHHHGGSARDPRVAAWAYAAKQRAVLRFLASWQGMPTAWLANLVMLLGLVPRSLAWLAIDLLRERGRSTPRLQKVRSAGFHLLALVSPARLKSTWEGPPCASS